MDVSVKNLPPFPAAVRNNTYSYLFPPVPNTGGPGGVGLHVPSELTPPNPPLPPPR